MPKPRTTIEWSVVEDDPVWQTDQPAAIPPITTQRMERRLVIGVAIVFLLLAVGWVRHRQLKLAAIKSELQATMASETRVAPAMPTPVGAVGSGRTELSTPDSAATTEADSLTSGLRWQAVQVHDLRLLADRAMTLVTVGYAAADGTLTPYRETRFYRRTATGWQSMAPDPDLLGPWQTLETTHFTIRYRPLDSSAVTAAAPRLDALYAKILWDFGLPVPSMQPKIRVEVAAASAPEVISDRGAARAIKVPSPALLSVPAEWPASTVLHQSWVYPLTGLVMEEVMDFYPIRHPVDRTPWQPVSSALRLWVLWESEGPLAEWRQDVVGWLVQNAQAPPGELDTVLPAIYEPFCHAYRVWGMSPWEMSIPLFCNAVDHSHWSAWSYPQLPQRLDQLTAVNEHRYPPADSMGNMIASMVAMETVIEYVVAEHGREQLPALLAAMGEHAHWQSLIPAVFGVSVAEFEAGWQTFVVDTYGDGATDSPSHHTGMLKRFHTR